MEKNEKELRSLLALLDDVVKDLALWSAFNKDLFTDEITTLRETSEAISEQTWKLGVEQ